jgi:ribose transport system permease protein
MGATGEYVADGGVLISARPRISLSTVRDYGIVGSLVALVIVLSLSTSAFLSTTNIANILDQWSSVGIIACGSTLVFIAGGFDLSVAAVYALAGVVAARVANLTSSDLGLLAGLASGCAVGATNGFLITVGRINAFIATLATSFVVEGLGLAITGGNLIPVNSPSFMTLGVNKLLGVKLDIWVFAAIALALGVVLHRSIFGRHIYAVGSNAEAARLSGVRVGGVRFSTFVISGACAAVGGLIAASMVATGDATTDINITFDAIIAIVLGGTSILGGSGAIWRTLVGLALLALIGNGFNLLGVNPVYQNIAFGLMLIFAVTVDAFSRRTQG